MISSLLNISAQSPRKSWKSQNHITAGAPVVIAVVGVSVHPLYPLFAQKPIKLYSHI